MPHAAATNIYPSSPGDARRACAVKGCCADLAAERVYLQRKHACARHVQAPAVQLQGRGNGLYRFCFQCGHFEPLSCFDGLKRSCRAKLCKRRDRAAAAAGTSCHHRPQRRRLAGIRPGCAGKYRAQPAKWLPAAAAAPSWEEKGRDRCAAAPACAAAGPLPDGGGGSSGGFAAPAPAAPAACLAAVVAAGAAAQGCSAGAALLQNPFEATLMELLAEEIAAGLLSCSADSSCCPLSSHIPALLARSTSTSSSASGGPTPAGTRAEAGGAAPAAAAAWGSGSSSGGMREAVVMMEEDAAPPSWSLPLLLPSSSAGCGCSNSSAGSHRASAPHDAQGHGGRGSAAAEAATAEARLQALQDQLTLAQARLRELSRQAAGVLGGAGGAAALPAACSCALGVGL